MYKYGAEPGGNGVLTSTLRLRVLQEASILRHAEHAQLA